MNSHLIPHEFSPTITKRLTRLILSVDDEPNILCTRQAVLESEGYEVLSALDGKIALALFDAHAAIDLVLLDFAMAGMDGLAVTWEMKTRRPYVPIFMISAHETALSKLALVNVDSLIPKGLGPAYLLEKIRQLLRPQSTERRIA